MIWGMLRNPGYADAAASANHAHADQPGLNGSARMAGHATPKSYSITDRPREDWLESPSRHS